MAPAWVRFVSTFMGLMCYVWASAPAHQAIWWELCLTDVPELRGMAKAIPKSLPRLAPVGPALPYSLSY